MFSGRIVPVKNPEFFARVCAGIRSRLGRCRVLIIGEGDEALKAAMRAVFDANGVDYDFAGFIPHDKLPEYYAQAKLLLLPTSGDCWGVVINEAMLAGTPGHHDGHDRGRGRARPGRGEWLRPAARRRGLGPGDRRPARGCREMGAVFGERPEQGPGIQFRPGRGGILEAFRYLDGDGPASAGR